MPSQPERYHGLTVDRHEAELCLPNEWGIRRPIGLKEVLNLGSVFGDPLVLRYLIASGGNNLLSRLSTLYHIKKTNEGNM